MIKSHEGQSVGNAMINALVAQEIARQKTIREAELEAEINTLRRELEIRKREERAAYMRYYEPEDDGILSAIWWALVGWVVLAVGALHDLIA